MGKLLALDHLLSKATVSPEEKDSNGISEQSHPQTKSYSQKSLGRDPLFVALDLSFQNLSNRCGSSDNFTNLESRISNLCIFLTIIYYDFFYQLAN